VEYTDESLLESSVLKRKVDLPIEDFYWEQRTDKKLSRKKGGKHAEAPQATMWSMESWTPEVFHGHMSSMDINQNSHVKKQQFHQSGYLDW
jgi:hypothetical protein